MTSKQQTQSYIQHCNQDQTVIMTIYLYERYDQKHDHGKNRGGSRYRSMYIWPKLGHSFPWMKEQDHSITVTRAGEPGYRSLK